MSKSADNMVDIIRDIAQQEIAKRGSVILCQVEEQKDEYHYDLTIVPDKSNIIHNVSNMTRFELSRGDYVYIYKVGNQLNNAFICYKIVPYADI